MNGHQPDDALTPVFALIAERRQALDQLEASLLKCREAFAGTMAPAIAAAATVAATGRKTRVSTDGRLVIPAGSVGDRLLGLMRQAGEPVAPSVLYDGAGADKRAVKAELRRLIEAKRVKQTGLSRGTRYELAK